MVKKEKEFQVFKEVQYKRGGCFKCITIQDKIGIPSLYMFN